MRRLSLLPVLVFALVTGSDDTGVLPTGPSDASSSLMNAVRMLLAGLSAPRSGSERGRQRCPTTRGEEERFCYASRKPAGKREFHLGFASCRHVIKEGHLVS